MSFWSIFSIVDKLLPGREERIRNKINSLKEEMKNFASDPDNKKKFTTRDAERYQRLANELSKLENKLQNR